MPLNASALDIPPGSAKINKNAHTVLRIISGKNAVPSTPSDALTVLKQITTLKTTVRK
jgi:hypothetical protein